jgi:outer membrane lipoprotein-sorting protein/peroxiredoxin
MPFSSRRNLNALCVCAFTVAGAFSNRIEYSIHAQEAAPEAAPAATPPSPSAIDPQAQIALKKMSAAYANLSSFSADVSLVATKGIVPSSAASVRWQRPNRFAISFFENGKTVRTVSDGKTIFRIAGSEYATMAVGSGLNSWKQALRVSGAGGLVLPTVDDLVSELQKPTTQSLTLSDGKEPGTQVVHALTKSGTETNLTEIFIVLGKTDHLMRQFRVRFPQNGKTVVGTETYSNVRANPLFPASTFVFTPPAGIKLRTSVVQETSTYFDPRLKVGSQPFAFATKDLSGAAISPAKYKGRVVLLDFWATWCGPCVGEMPTVKAVYNKLHAKGFDIVGISLDQDRGALDNFLKTQNVQWPQVFDGKGWGNAIANQYGVKAIPFALLIGRDGKIAAVNVRGDALEPAVRVALARR